PRASVAAAGPVRAATLRAPEAGDAVGRLPPAPDAGPRNRASPATTLSRRAHDRPRSTGARRRLAARRWASGGGPRDRPDHALYGRGRAAQRRAYRAGP